MDLLNTVKKEGSRGGLGDFKWSDVQNSSHREHYLGHSVMAPVGRWAKNRDLTWYAKANDDSNDAENAEEKAVRQRKEEIKRIKEAEEDALARALGLPVPDRTNANLMPAGDGRKATAEGAADKQDEEEVKLALKEYKRRHEGDRSHRRRRRSRSSSPRSHHDNHRRRRHRSRSNERPRRRSRSRSRERDRHHRRRSRSPRRPQRRSRD